MVMKHLEGAPLSADYAKTLGIKFCLKTGLPMILGPKGIASIVSGHTESIRLILTILTASRALKLGKVPDYSTIEEPGCTGASFSELVSDMEKYSVQF